MEKIKITKAQKRFADEYLIDFNGTRAYKVAYPRCLKDATARTNASRMLTNANIQNYINEKQKKIEKRTEVTQDKVINELAKIAFYDIKNLYDEQGVLKQVCDIEGDISRAISTVESKKMKMLDKVKALELLGKHLGMFNDVNLNMQNGITVEIVDDLHD